jgi:pyruvate kinase (EC 2.7.1.40)
MRRTKIVCTIGPASESVDMLVRLINAGMNVARLNFSHGDHEEHKRRIENIHEAERITGKTVAIMLDTKGPEIRTHNMKEGAIHLKAGKQVTIAMEEVLGTEERFSITYPGLIHDVHIGSKILLDDGLIQLKVVGIDKEKREIRAEVLNNGVLKDKKGVNVPGVSVQLPGITEKDAEDILFGIENGIDYIAASFVRRASDVLEIRKLLEKHNAEHIWIIPKIENQEGVDNIDEILQVSDGLMVARGDLGVEIPVEEVPLVQKMLIQKCNASAKPVITATQMLDSMQRNLRPTRAEASDVANAIFDGTDAIMLSGETAAGLYPVEAVQTMHSIALRAESALNHKEILAKRSRETEHNMTDAICQSVAHTVINLDIDAIITPTESGHTARMVSKYRPKAPIIAVTSQEKTYKQLNLIWGVCPRLAEGSDNTDQMLEIAVKEGLQSGIVKSGHKVVITAGVPVGHAGTTNMMKIHVVGTVLAKGQGIGKKTAFGKIVRVKSAKEALEKVDEDSILVIQSSDSEMVPAMKKAKALIAVEGGLTSHAAVVGLNYGIPVIVGVENAFDVLKEGAEVTVDAGSGFIYEGHASVL